MAATGGTTQAPEPAQTPREARTVPLTSRRPSAEQRREGEARRKIAFILVWGYLGILTLTIIAPVVIVKLIGSTNAEIDAVRSLSEGIAPLMTAVVGVLGFVLGYYFKSEEKLPPNISPSDQPRRRRMSSATGVLLKSFGLLGRDAPRVATQEARSRQASS